jgi:hypothetical protein
LRPIYNRDIPYLKPLQSDVDRMAAHVPRDGNLRVGLAWSGNPQHPKDSLRSCRLEDLAPIIAVPGCTFYSIQAIDHDALEGSGLIDLNCYCHDVADTAAAIANLDLVITIDSMPAHLCGAIGAQCLVMLGKCPDWRWGSKEQNAWYASVRCVRGGDDGIAGAIRNAAVELRKIVDTTTVGLPSEPVPVEPPIKYLNCRYGLMHFHSRDHYIGRSLDLYREYSQEESELFHKLLKPGDVVVEAGANIGALTVALADAVGERGRVIAFEPQPEYFSLLNKNCSMLKQVEIHEAGLSDAPGSIDLGSIPMDMVHAPGWAP